MTAVFDTYVSGDSLLHRLDPRVKLWGLVLGFAMAFGLPGLLAQILMLVSIHVLLLLSQIPWRDLWRFWKQMAMLMVLILVLQPWVQPSGRELVSWGPLQLTVGGILDALHIATRSLVVAFLTAGLLFTTNHRSLVLAFVRLGLPYTWGLTISLTLRFLPAIQSLFRAVRNAQAARGWTPRGGPLKRLREYLPVLVAVMISTLRMSDQLTLALAARGLTSERSRTLWRDLTMQSCDWLILIGSTLGFVLLMIMRFNFA
jgi:energy-coupling factor transport system permease protein